VSQVQAPIDTSYDNLGRQGFEIRPDLFKTWKITQVDVIDKKAVEMQPTNPELDIQQTGRCEIWIREIILIAQVKLARTEAHCIDPDFPVNPACHATLPQVSDATRTALYITPDGNCHGNGELCRYAKHTTCRKKERKTTPTR